MLYAKNAKKTETEAKQKAFLSHFYRWWHFNWGGGPLASPPPPPPPGYAYGLNPNHATSLPFGHATEYPISLARMLFATNNNISSCLELVAGAYSRTT